VINEIKVYADESIVVGHGGCRESARRDIQSNIPPVIHQRGECEPDLPDYLGPHVQRAIGVFPLC
jgi:hypothetical protein